MLPLPMAVVRIARLQQLPRVHIGLVCCARKLGSNRRALMQQQRYIRKIREPAGSFFRQKYRRRKNLLTIIRYRLRGTKLTGTVYAICWRQDRKRRATTRLNQSLQSLNARQLQSSTCSLPHDWNRSLPAEARGRVSCDSPSVPSISPVAARRLESGEGRGPCDSSCPGAAGLTPSGRKLEEHTFLFAPPRHRPAGRPQSACGLSLFTARWRQQRQHSAGWHFCGRSYSVKPRSSSRPKTMELLHRARSPLSCLRFFGF